MVTPSMTVPALNWELYRPKPKKDFQLLFHVLREVVAFTVWMKVVLNVVMTSCQQTGQNERMTRMREAAV